MQIPAQFIADLKDFLCIQMFGIMHADSAVFLVAKIDLQTQSSITAPFNKISYIRRKETEFGGNLWHLIKMCC